MQIPAMARLRVVVGIGANGFYLKQVTGDSGSGAPLGGFREMTAGVGPVLSYAAQFGKIGFAADRAPSRPRGATAT